MIQKIIIFYTIRRDSKSERIKKFHNEYYFTVHNDNHIDVEILFRLIICIK